MQTAEWSTFTEIKKEFQFLVLHKICKLKHFKRPMSIYVCFQKLSMSWFFPHSQTSNDFKDLSEPCINIFLDITKAKNLPSTSCSSCEVWKNTENWCHGRWVMLPSSVCCGERVSVSVLLITVCRQSGHSWRCTSCSSAHPARRTCWWTSPGSAGMPRRQSLSCARCDRDDGLLHRNGRLLCAGRQKTKTN